MVAPGQRSEPGKKELPAIPATVCAEVGTSPQIHLSGQQDLSRTHHSSHWKEQINPVPTSQIIHLDCQMIFGKGQHVILKETGFTFSSYPHKIAVIKTNCNMLNLIENRIRVILHVPLNNVNNLI